ncbi:hypothetical protein BGZ51_002193 [Haplosporangium sp. Z 767]|nr:hypothetical protein BGZ51_002193 [Haplosporangium sp. Z 767]KAF9187204.1 hypothetical protein BGZ50_002061 [Haplosporangium sp. Z 11]
MSTSSVSSSSSTVSTLSSDLTANTTATAGTTSVHRATSSSLPRFPASQIYHGQHKRPSSLRQHSFEYRTQGISTNSTVASRNRSSITRLKDRNLSNTNTSAHSSAQLEQLKLKKITRLLQLLIACTSVQARLPALRYPGYGRQWIRPPCRVDYLQHYVDQEQGGDIMMRCFHLLFADLIHCQWEDEAQTKGGIPVAPPDKEAYRVLYQIQKEFMTHNAARIRTLSLSVVHTVDHAITLVPQLAMVTRLELTDLGEASFQAEPLVDFIKSHRMLFGPVLKEIILVEKQSSATSTTPTTPSTFASSVSSAVLPFAGYNTRITSASNVAAVIEAFRDPECIDATAWANCILYLDRLSTGQLKKLWLSYAFPPFEAADGKVARLAELLERCRRLEQIRIPIRRSDVFAWAAREKKTALICTPILASKRLPHMRTVHIQGPTLELMDCVQDVAFAFRDTLEDLEACSRLRVWQPSTLEWQWAIPHLTRLRLEGEISLYFSLDSLKWCPALEELFLATVTTEDRKLHPQQQLQQRLLHQQHPHLTLPAFHGPDPGLNLLIYIRSRELHMIANLKRLRVLNICGPWQVPDTALRGIAERCRRLKVLQLDQTVGTSIGGILLAVENMHRLEQLALRLDIVDLVLVRVVAKKLAFLSSLQLTSLCKEG